MEETTKIGPLTLVQRAQGLVFTQLDDELVAIDAPHDVGYALNESAGKVWELIAAPISVSTICARLRQEYRVDEQVCLGEVSALLQRLCDAGLVQINDGAHF
jgi:Coenzyme PQQ synthesis protein D (PqqD)